MAGRSSTEWYKEKEKDSPIKLASELCTNLETTTIYGWDRPANQDNRRERKARVYVHSANNVETLITCLNQFLQVREDLNLNGPEHFSEYKKTLSVGLQQTWEAHVQGVHRTVANFNTYVHSFINKYTKAGSFEKFQDYFKIVCKHFSLTVMEMHTRLELMNQLSLHLSKQDSSKPNAEEIFSVDQVKAYWAKSMPSPWLDKWKEIHPGPAGALDNRTFEELLAHFEACESHEEEERRKRRSQTQSRPTGRGGRTGRGPTARGGRYAGRGFNRGGFRASPYPPPNAYRATPTPGRFQPFYQPRQYQPGAPPYQQQQQPVRPPFDGRGRGRTPFRGQR